MDKNILLSVELTEKERNLIKYLRNIQYGDVWIFMQDGQPVRIEKAKESIRL